MKIKQDFFIRPTLEVARDLIGKVIVRNPPAGTNGKQIMGRIVESEAYIGEDDRACHARFGRTKRNEPMYKSGGRTYIYLCYGLFNLLNFVTDEEGRPAAVLVRRIKPLSGLDPSLKSYGPGNLTKYLKIDRELNDVELFGENLFIEDDGFKIKKIIRGERVGVSYAGAHAKRKWRFILEDKLD